MRGAAVGLCLILLSAPVSAADWVYVTSSTSDADFYHDPASVRRVGNYLAAWRKVDHSTNESVAYYESKDLWYYDCANVQQALKSFTNYTRSGSVESSDTISDYVLKWQPVVPDSVGARFYRLICGN